MFDLVTAQMHFRMGIRWKLIVNFSAIRWLLIIVYNICHEILCEYLDVQQNIVYHITVLVTIWMRLLLGITEHRN